MAEHVITRTHRIVGALAGVFFGGNVVVLGVFLELLVVSAVAGLFIAAGTALLVPAVIHAGRTGGFPPSTAGSVLGTGLNAGAAGIALDVAGLATVFAGFVFDTPLPPVVVGVVLLGAGYLLLDRLLPQQAAGDADDSGDGESGDSALTSALGVLAGILLYSGVTAWSTSPAAALAVGGVGVVLVGIGARREGYV